MIGITLETIQKTLSHVTLNQLNKLPEISVIYYVVVNERVLYVGQATNLKTRWRNHHRTLQLTVFTHADIPVKIYWRECEKSSLNQEESEAIKSLNPPLNRSPVIHNPIARAKLKNENSDRESQKTTPFQKTFLEDGLVFRLPKETVRKISLGLEAGFSKQEVLNKCLLEQTTFVKIITPYLEYFVSNSIIATWYFNVEGLSKKESISKASTTKRRSSTVMIMDAPKF